MSKHYNGQNGGLSSRKFGRTYRQMTEKTMRRTGEKMLAMPRAKHRIMHTTPVLKE
jgi:hypothetical protein